MLLLSLTTEEMTFLTDISKTVIPLFAALGGAMTGSYLTYRFQKKDKIRDHLFTYKVKSYSAIVEGVNEAKRELEKKRNDNFLSQSLLNQLPVDKKKASEIWDEIRKITAEQALFLSGKTSSDLSSLNDAIFSVVFFESKYPLVMNSLLISTETKNKYEEKITHAIYECNQFVKKVQSDLRIDKLNNNKL